MMRDQLV